MCKSSSALQQIAEVIAQAGDPAFFINDVRAIAEGMKAYRQIEPDRNVVIVIEDVDELVRYNEHQLLQLMDGNDKFEHCLFLATTNYLDRLPPRMLRSGRFDKKIEVGPPPYEGRLAYLHHKIKDVAEADELENLARETEGLNWADMKELIVAAYALKENPRDVLDRLTGRSRDVGKEAIAQA